MNRTALIDRLAANQGHLTTGYCDTALRLVLQAIGSALAEGRRVEFRNFGTSRRMSGVHG